MDTDSNLCVACTQALTIDDKLAGGSVKSASDGTAMLDIGKFALDLQSARFLNLSRLDFGTEENIDRTQWFEAGWDYAGRASLVRPSYSGQDVERVVVPPDLSELSASMARVCRFCRSSKLFYDAITASATGGRTRTPESGSLHIMSGQRLVSRTTEEHVTMIVRSMHAG